jgi:two-component system heavy metal sensor histidine kinase CusS
MRRPSLTLRLTLLFAAGSTGVLLLLGWLVAQSVQAHFVEQDRMELVGKVELVRNILSRTRERDDLETVAGRLDDALTGHHHLSLRLVEADGSVPYESPGHPFPAASFPLRADKVRIGPPEIATWRDGARDFRGTVARVPGGPGAPDIVVAVALDIEHHVEYLRAFNRSLWISIAACALLIGLLGWAAARRGLAPVRDMAIVAQRISASRLDDRLAVETLPPELTELAVAFNGMLARLEESFRRLSDFSSDLAHEFKTPLSNLMMQAEVALSRSRSPEEYREVLYSSLEECERLARTVSDMLFLAKADHGAIIPSVEKVDLAGEVRELFDFYDALVEERRVALALEGEATVAGDRLMIRRALGNLLSNAIAHTPADGRVTVAIAAPPGGPVTIAVENVGEEIPAEHLPRLFDRFYRVDPARQRTSGGAGLGLAITKSIVAAHGGAITVASGGGVTRFAVTLPAAPAP